MPHCREKQTLANFAVRFFRSCEKSSSIQVDYHYCAMSLFEWTRNVRLQKLNKREFGITTKTHDSGFIRRLEGKA